MPPLALQVAAVLGGMQWLAVGAVVAGLVLASVFGDLLPGWGTHLLWAGAVALTAAPFLGLLRAGVGAEERRRRLSWYALGALAIAAIGALLAG